MSENQARISCAQPIQPSAVRDWDAELAEKRLATNTRAVLFAHLSAILTAAVDDGVKGQGEALSGGL